MSASEKGAGFNITATSNEANSKLYLVPFGTYTNEAALNVAKVAEATQTLANTATTLAVVGGNVALTDNAVFQVYAVNAAGNVSTGVDVFSVDLTPPTGAIVAGGVAANNARQFSVLYNGPNTFFTITQQSITSNTASLSGITFTISGSGASTNDTINFAYNDQAGNATNYIATYNGTRWSIATE